MGVCMSVRKCNGPNFKEHSFQIWNKNHIKGHIDKNYNFPANSSGFNQLVQHKAQNGFPSSGNLNDNVDYPTKCKHLIWRNKFYYWISYGFYKFAQLSFLSIMFYFFTIPNFPSCQLLLLVSTSITIIHYYYYYNYYSLV